MKKILDTILIFVMVSAMSGCAYGFFGEKVPDGIIHKDQVVVRLSPPEGFTKVVAWAHAVTYSKENKKKAFVYVEYLRLIEEVDGKRTVVYEDRYEGCGSLPADRGGIFVREPRWFDIDDHTPMTNSAILDNKLVIIVSDQPNGILHWWTKRVDAKPGAKYYAEIKCKIVGDAAVQIGVDFWKDDSAPYNGWDENCFEKNNCEAFVSKPFGPTGDKWADITVPR